MALQGIRTVVNSAAHLGSQCEIFKLKKGSTFQTHRPQQFHHFRQLYSACTPDQHTLPGVMCHGGKCWNGIRKNLLWVLVLHGLYHPMSEADFRYALPVACCRHCAWPTNVSSFFPREIIEVRWPAVCITAWSSKRWITHLPKWK